MKQVAPLLAALEQETAIPSEAKDMLALLGRQIADLDPSIRQIDAKLTAAHKANAVCHLGAHTELVETKCPI